MASMSEYYGGVLGTTEGVKRTAIATLFGLVPNNVQAWTPGASVTAPDELRIYNDTFVYFAPTATPSSPVTMLGVGPENDLLWSKKSVSRKLITNTDLATSIDVFGGDILMLTNSSATSIALLGGYDNQEITIIFADSNTTIVTGVNMKLSGGVNYNGLESSTLKLVLVDSTWYEVSRSVNS